MFWPHYICYKTIYELYMSNSFKCLTQQHLNSLHWKIDKQHKNENHNIIIEYINNLYILSHPGSYPLDIVSFM